MKRLQISLTSILFTISLSWFSSTSGKVMQPNATLFVGMKEHHFNFLASTITSNASLR